MRGWMQGCGKVWESKSRWLLLLPAGLLESRMAERGQVEVGERRGRQGCGKGSEGFEVLQAGVGVARGLLRKPNVRGRVGGQCTQCS